MSEFDKLKDEAERNEGASGAGQGGSAGRREKLARTASTDRHDQGNAPQGDQAGQLQGG